MRIALLTLIAILCQLRLLAAVDTFRVGGNLLFAHVIRSPQQPRKGLVIFLHGSVKAYRDRSENSPIQLNELLEGNAFFTGVCADMGYDLVAPVVWKEFNWLEPSGAIWLDSLMARYASQNEDVILSGFSDGGTGAYRYFYTHPERFSALWVMNGYPQLQNFYRTVNYRNNPGRPVVFLSQADDDVVPYEFLLTEYRRQKLFNPATFFCLLPGAHEMAKYSAESFRNALQWLSRSVPAIDAPSGSMWVYPPLDALMDDDLLLEQYRFRSRVGKRFGMKGKELESIRCEDFRSASDSIRIYPLLLPLTQLTQSELQFEGQGPKGRFYLKLPNYSAFSAW